MLKKLLVCGTAVALLGLVGCFDNPLENEDEVTITVTLASATLVAGQNVNVSGSIKGTPDPTDVVYEIYTAAGTKVVDGSVTVSAQTVTADDNIDLRTDANVVISATSTACNGSYTLKISASAGTAETTKNSPAFEVTNGRDCGTAPVGIVLDTMTLGSWDNNTYGSSLDADLMKVWKLSLLTTDALRSEIDVWFSNTSSGKAAFWSPAQAAAANYSPKNWTTKNATEMKKVGTLTSLLPQLAAATDVDAAIQTLWTAGAASSEYLEVSANDVIIVKTNEGAYKAVFVVSAETTDSGTAVVIGVM